MPTNSMSLATVGIVFLVLGTMSQYHEPAKFFEAALGQMEDVSTKESTAKNFKFDLFSNQQSVSDGTLPDIRGYICPSLPGPSNNLEGFTDPETGFVVPDDGGVVIIYNYTNITHSIGGSKIKTDFFRRIDCSAQLETIAYADGIGEWTVHAKAKWKSQGIIYMLESNSLNFTVSPRQFAVGSQNTNGNMTYEGQNFIGNVRLHNPSIFAFNVTGLQGLPQNAEPLDVSPDNTKILFRYTTQEGVQRLGLTNIDGTQTVDLGSPDNTFENGNNNTKSYSQYLAQYNYEPILQALFSSSGSRIYALWNFTLFANDGTSSGFTKVDATGNAIVSFDALSDGSTIAYAKEEMSDENHPQVNLYFINDTSSTTNKTQKILDGNNTIDLSIFDVSPDGNKIAFYKTLASAGGSIIRNVAIYDIQSKQVSEIPNIQVTCSENLKWSPNSQYIIYHDRECERTASAGGSLQLTDLKGNREILLAGGSYNPRSFALTSDGWSIIYSFDSPISKLDKSAGAMQADLYRLTLARPIPEFPSMITFGTLSGILMFIIIILLVASKNLNHAGPMPDGHSKVQT